MVSKAPIFCTDNSFWVFTGRGRKKLVMGLKNLGQFGVFVKEGWDKALSVAKFLCFLHVTSTYLVGSALVYGPSMLPTIGLTASVVLTEKISTRFGRVGRGDIVIVRSPKDPRKLITKRLLALEGDSVTYVVDPKTSDECETVVVPKGHIWVQGDNIYKSTDSRQFGPVPYGLLYGKVFWSVWPPKAFGPLGKN